MKGRLATLGRTAPLGTLLIADNRELISAGRPLGRDMIVGRRLKSLGATPLLGRALMTDSKELMSADRPVGRAVTIGRLMPLGRALISEGRLDAKALDKTPLGKALISESRELN